MEASTIEEAKMYLLNRARQLMHAGLRFVEFMPQLSDKTVWAKFIYNNQYVYSCYILNQHRGSGIFMTEYALMSDEVGCDLTITTSSDCSIVDFLKKMNIPYMLIDGLTQESEYKRMEEFYGDGIAQRSGVFFMNHLDEGLYILKEIGASRNAQLAYLLHPMYQSDEDLTNVFGNLYQPTNLVDAYHTQRILVLAMEYRSVANEYLSKREINSIEEIRLSPLIDVNDMLIADKVQNRKDFLMYHLGTHARSEALDQYFINWLKRLGVTEGEYDTLTIPIVALDGEYNRLKRKTEQ